MRSKAEAGLSNLEKVCKDVLTIDSSSSFGTNAVAQFLAKYAETAGLIVEQHACTASDSNIRVSTGSLGSNDKVKLILQSHLDSEEAHALQEYKERGLNPFQPSLDGNKIYGLGASSGKLDAVCQIAGLALARAERPDVSCFTLGTFGRFQGMTGALRATRHGWLHGESAIVAEATSSRALVATKGLATIRIQLPLSPEEIEFRTNHNLQESTSSQVQIFSGDRSLKKAFEYLIHLPRRGLALIDFDCSAENPQQTVLDLDTGFAHRSVLQNLCEIYEALVELERDFLSIRDSTFTPSTPTWQLQSTKTLTDSVEITGTCAMLPQVKSEIYEEWLKRIRIAVQKIGGAFTIVDYKRPFQSAPKSPLLERVNGLLGTIEHQKSSVPNEASLLSRLGIDCICFGAGERVGQGLERADLASLEKAVLFYREIILK